MPRRYKRDGSRVRDLIGMLDLLFVGELSLETAVRKMGV